ncbi:MAG TPA: retroviral-like aspartic protease family protein [Rhizomicrobium sp.]|jgi:predicted aspartyl protease|nr:retroviral-like aspartic protease family protein [Rhizomicrobium sp.]
MRILPFASVLFVFQTAAGFAAAENSCPPLTMVASVNMQIGSDGRIYVPAAINGTPKSLLLDTGGVITEITRAAADELKLPTRRTDLEIIGVTGDTTRVAARGDLTLGNLHAERVDFMLLPSMHELASDISDAVGILGPNLLRSYDLDLDFAGKKVNLISQNHCEGKVVYWPASSVAVVPIRVNSAGHIFLPVTLDGQKLTAQLDTGASGSVLDLAVAQNELGVKLGGSDTPEEGTMANGMAKTYSHRFKTLELEGIGIANPRFDLVPDRMSGKQTDPGDSLKGGSRLPVGDTEIGLGDMLLGMDILHHLHVYIAYKEEKLYLTAAVPPAASASAPATTAAAKGAGAK